MLILELAVQAVRGFSPSARIALKPGYIGLLSPTPAPAPLSNLLVALCYPDGRGGDAALLAPGAKVGKAGLSLQGTDQLIYRLVRELGGQGALHKLNRTTNQFEVVTQDASEMAQVLRGAVGFPPRTTFEQLFTFSVTQLPTRRPKPKKKVSFSEEKTQPRLASSFDAPVRAAEDLEAARTQVAKLENEKAVANEVADLQFKLDGLSAEQFKLEGKTNDFKAMRGRVTEAQQRLASLPTPEKLKVGPEIFQRMRSFDDEKQRFTDALARLETEKQQALGDDGDPAPPLVSDPRFLASLGAGLGLVVLGLFMEGAGKYVALLAVPAFTVAALFALRYIEALQRSGKQDSASEIFGAREKKLTDDFALFEKTIEATLNTVGANSIEDFFTILRQAEDMRPEVERQEAELRAYEQSPEFQDASRRMAEIKAEQDRANARMLSMSGGFMRDLRDIDRELGRLKESIALALAPAAPQPTTGLSAISAAPTETFEDPVPALMGLAVDLFGGDVPSVWQTLQGRALQYLQALSDRRYYGLEVDLDGFATVQAPGRAIPAGELPGRDLDLVYLSLRLTIVEKYSAQGKTPVVFEDSFSTALDPAKQPLLGRMLKHLGTLTQVLHVTPAGQNAASAEMQLTL